MKPVTRQRLLCIVSDYLMLNIGWLLFNVVRYHSLPLGWLNSAADFMLMPPVLLGQLLVPLLAVGLYAMSGYYNAPFDRSRVDDALNTAGVSALAALMIFFAVLINDDIPERLLNYQLLLILWLLLAAPVYACRYVLTAGVKRRVSNGSLRFGTLIVGTGPKAFDLEERIRRVPTAMGFDILARVGDAEEAISLDEATDMVRSGLVANVILAGDDTDPRHVAALIGRFVPLGCGREMPHETRRRPRGLGHSPRGPAAGICRHSSGSEHGFARPGVLQPGARGLPQPPLPHLQVPHHAARRRGGRTAAQQRRRPAHHPRRSRAAQIPPRRAATVLERAAGPDEPRGAPARARTLRKAHRRARAIRGPVPQGQFGFAGSVDEMVERLAYDLLYIENVSLGVDLRIMLHTINTVLTGKGV